MPLQATLLAVVAVVALPFISFAMALYGIVTLSVVGITEVVTPLALLLEVQPEE